MAEQMTELSHGRARAGVGRKPKAFLYAELAACAEQKVAGALPAIIDSMIESAEGGNLGAAHYLCDRSWGAWPSPAPRQ